MPKKVWQCRSRLPFPNGSLVSRVRSRIARIGLVRQNSKLNDRCGEVLPRFLIAKDFSVADQHRSGTIWATNKKGVKKLVPNIRNRSAAKKWQLIVTSMQGTTQRR